MDKKKGNKVISTICYVIGSLAALMPRISGTITKAAAKRTNANRDDDDWGPVIEKKEVSTEEEDTDAD